MNCVADQLPDDLASAHTMILAERAARREAEAIAARAQAVNAHSDALIARLRLEIEKLNRDIQGSRSERKARLLEQMELQLEELGADASQEDGRICLTNNAAERALRGFALATCGPGRMVTVYWSCSPTQMI
ncbi:transposase [Mesorhizobium sp. CCNWLW179-1]|uniref:IS66 family transposase n=1 Tax=Mesorhizobium sp. CCNWLW179-1 TaxID=3136721 RepID=UPI00301565A1